jgi:hypothetical protein
MQSRGKVCAAALIAARHGAGANGEYFDSAAAQPTKLSFPKFSKASFSRRRQESESLSLSIPLGLVRSESRRSKLDDVMRHHTRSPKENNRVN